ncbi:hypothetical protein DIPPA_12521 [Diplonema papillatum]|nr:hypothetical protein DIPPA_12521 [Diplonema papillatum]
MASFGTLGTTSLIGGSYVSDSSTCSVCTPQIAKRAKCPHGSRHRSKEASTASAPTDPTASNAESSRVPHGRKHGKTFSAAGTGAGNRRLPHHEADATDWKQVALFYQRSVNEEAEKHRETLVKLSTLMAQQAEASAAESLHLADDPAPSGRRGHPGGAPSSFGQEQRSPFGYRAARPPSPLRRSHFEGAAGAADDPFAEPKAVSPPRAAAAARRAPRPSGGAPGGTEAGRAAGPTAAAANLLDFFPCSSSEPAPMPAAPRPFGGGFASDLRSRPELGQFTGQLSPHSSPRSASRRVTTVRCSTCDRSPTRRHGHTSSTLDVSPSREHSRVHQAPALMTEIEAGAGRKKIDSNKPGAHAFKSALRFDDASTERDRASKLGAGRRASSRPPASSRVSLSIPCTESRIRGAAGGGGPSRGSPKRPAAADRIQLGSSPGGFHDGWTTSRGSVQRTRSTTPSHGTSASPVVRDGLMRLPPPDEASVVTLQRIDDLEAVVQSLRRGKLELEHETDRLAVENDGFRQRLFEADNVLNTLRLMKNDVNRMKCFQGKDFGVSIKREDTLRHMDSAVEQLAYRWRVP